MRKVKEGHWIVSDTLDLIHHEENVECGLMSCWYYQRFPEQDTSQGFTTQRDAEQAEAKGELVWGSK